MEHKNALFEMPEAKVIFFDNEDVLTTDYGSQTSNSAESTNGSTNDNYINSETEGSVVQTSVDEQAYEGASADEPLMEESTFEDIPVEESTFENTPVDESLYEEPTFEETPAEESSSSKRIPWAF